MIIGSYQNPRRNIAQPSTYYEDTEYERGRNRVKKLINK
jgi:hypothetical protein